LRGLRLAGSRLLQLECGSSFRTVSSPRTSSTCCCAARRRIGVRGVVLMAAQQLIRADSAGCLPSYCALAAVGFWNEGTLPLPAGQPRKITRRHLPRPHTVPAQYPLAPPARAGVRTGQVSPAGRPSRPRLRTRRASRAHPKGAAGRPSRPVGPGLAARTGGSRPRRASPEGPNGVLGLRSTRFGAATRGHAPWALPS
jgi:hypothetical protein